jgi:hypothetical protein
MDSFSCQEAFFTGELFILVRYTETLYGVLLLISLEWAWLS